jgi:hypothetical protein
MKKYKYFKMVIGLFAVLLVMSSCIEEGEDTVGDAGKTLVKFYPADFNLLALNATDVSQTGALLEVRRDVKSESALSKPATVVIKFDTDTMMINNYNQQLVDDWMAEDTSRHDPADYDGPVYELLPYDFYTLDPSLSSDGTLTMDFAAGEFAKNINITIPNSLLFDFSKLYVVAFQITEVTGEGTLSLGQSDMIIAQVLVKNKWDGVYEVTALSPMVDVLNANFTGFYPFIYSLETTGANTCICIDKTVWYTYMHPMTNAGATSGYGSFGLEVEFDPQTGDIVAVYNPWGNPPGNTRMPVIDASGVNKWDEATGNILFKYWMIQPSLVPSAPHIRVYFDEKWTYKGAR